MSSAINAITNAIGSLAGRSQPFAVATGASNARDTRHDDPQALYALLSALYDNNDVYSETNRLIQTRELKSGAIQGLRNPTFAVCNFHAFTLWPGTLPDALPIETPERADAKRQRGTTVSLPGTATKETASDRLEAAILRGWAASNWGEKKQEFARGLPKLGDQFFKAIATKGGARAAFQLIEPPFVTDFDTDLRGFLTYIRVDVLDVRRDANGKPQPFIITEVWDKDTGRYRQWERAQSLWSVGDPSQLGTPTVDEDMAMFGVDFVPFKQCKFLNEGPGRGTAAIMPALDKIIYGDLLVTALHQRLTNHNIPEKVLKGTGQDALGKPLPPPRLSEQDGVVEVNGVKLWRLPAGWEIDNTVAQLDYAAHLEVVEKHYEALRQSDIPQMTWYAISEAGGDLSGKALNYKLKPAIAIAEEARGNAEEALKQATQMMLTVGQFLNLPGYSQAEIGTFENGDFEHAYAPRNIVNLSEQEEADMMLVKANVVAALVNAGANIQAAAEWAGISAEDALALAQVDLVVTQQ